MTLFSHFIIKKSTFFAAEEAAKILVKWLQVQKTQKPLDFIHKFDRNKEEMMS